MGRQSRRFIQKKNAAVYQVVHQSYEDGNEDDTRIALKPVKAGTAGQRSEEELGFVVPRSRAPRSLHDQEPKEFLPEPDEAEYEGSVKFPENEIELLRDRSDRHGFESRDYDADGILIDGYDYSRHLKPIGEDPSAIFIAAEGAVLAARDVALKPPNKLLPAEETFSILLPSTDLEEADDEILEAMRAIEDPNCEPEELWGGALDDDFVMQATAGKKYEVVIQDEEAYYTQHDDDDLFGEGEEEDEDDDNQPWEVPDQDEPPPYERTVMDERLDELLKEYDDDDIGELDESDALRTTGLDVSHFSQVIDSFLETGPFGVFKNPEMPNYIPKGVIPIGKYSALDRVDRGNPYDILDQMRREAKAEGLTDVPITETEEETDAALEEMLSRPKEDEWDCETILTTYSNLENHPRYIVEPKTVKVKISKKTGIPIFVGDEAGTEGGKTKDNNNSTSIATSNSNADAVKAGEQQQGTSGEGGEENEVDEDGAPVVPAFRPRDETAEEKRARKRAVKEAKKNRREEKKETKEMFRQEEQKQAAHQQILKKNPNRVRL